MTKVAQISPGLSNIPPIHLPWEKRPRKKNTCHPTTTPFFFRIKGAKFGKASTCFMWHKWCKVKRQGPRLLGPKAFWSTWLPTGKTDRVGEKVGKTPKVPGTWVILGSGLVFLFRFAWFLSYFLEDVVRSGLTSLPLVSLSTTIAPLSNGELCSIVFASNIYTPEH